MLRQALQAMTDSLDVSQHPAMLVKLGREFPHSIELVSSPHAIRRYTCLMYVFGFPEKSEYVAIAGNGAGDVFAGQEFAHWLIDGGHLDTLSQDEVHDGDIVFYFDGSNFKHAGLLIQGRVTSKWGLGELYQQELLEVPSTAPISDSIVELRRRER